MRIVSWNVNGLRACAGKGFADWLAGAEADVVGLQEVRARPDQLDAALARPEGWHVHANPAERPGYSGVTLFSRQPPSAVHTSLGDAAFDVEGRYQEAHLGDLVVVNAYFPNGNGKNRDLSRIPYKLDFYRAVFDRLEPARAAGRPVLVMGDFNTAHRPIDLARPKDNEKTSGFRPEEREELDRWLRSGWTDTFRHVHGDTEGAYTWWSQRGGCRERNVGWRIDYVLASPGALEILTDAFIHPHVAGSDHCPIGVALNL
ncbi:MAG: exodeoxyribonuclease III [Deltaproteobacteria bacterium]|nr:exodeoxyribonuclease III [Deltaproteobacteria bacterium]MCB9788402.1 exodeoxyribonuclease III [Deltaproteobacteria bacterium]